MNSAPLLVDRCGHVALLTLDRPAKLNALSSALRLAIIGTLNDLASDDAVHAVVLTGAGRAFCAGLDLTEIASSGRSVEENVAAENVVDAIVAFPKPLIGAINGTAVTGGFEIALALDILLVGEMATFVDSHVALGIAPGWGLSQRLARTVGLSRANELSLSGRPLGAAEAVAWGLANSVYRADELIPAALALAARIAGHDPSAVERMKRDIAEGWLRPLGEALQHEAAAARRANLSVDSTSVAERFARARRRERGLAQEQDAVDARA